MTVFIAIVTKMIFIKYVSIIIIWLDTVRAGLAVRKFVYQVDLSEHCRRRVMPSVFLGRHVVEANSQILHFSQLDVPYSCYISIRYVHLDIGDTCNVFKLQTILWKYRKAQFKKKKCIPGLLS